MWNVDIDVRTDYVRFCGCPAWDECGHLEGMTPSELREIDAFEQLSLDEANQILKWLRDEARADRTYSPHDSELLLEQLTIQ